jgi:hypothetical protein
MYVIINSECDAIPEGSKPLISEGTALLNLLLCLNYNPAEPPLADLLRRYHHLDGDWLILSLVHWQATHNDALIAATGKELELQESESKLWFDLFTDYFAVDGLRLHYHDAETWLLNAPQQHSLTAKPAHRLVNQSLMPELTQLDRTLFWQKFITESQMLFASKPNQSAVNGVWPWSGAKLTKKATAICADAHFFPLATMCSTQVTLYSPTVTRKEQSILLITEPSELSAEHQDELTKIVAHWYWNNVAYTSSHCYWFTRLWRKLIHAY